MLGPHSNAVRALEEADSAMYVRKAQRRHEPPAVIASQRVRAKRGPMTGSAKQSRRRE
jgi:hypothetical protein